VVVLVSDVVVLASEVVVLGSGEGGGVAYQ
jgi:hypothetical protein